ncbi:MAG: GDSL-type esterase/lipase family protein [Planctomycetota bacterium]
MTESSPTAQRGTQRRVPLRRKLAALAIGTVGALLTLEVVLAVLHLMYAPETRELADTLAPAPGERRIVCMGDSNTYGVYLDPQQSYPGRLQQYLDRAEGNPWRVINLGYPGQNTAQMRGRLAQNLDAYRPEVLVLWGGVNNSWSPAMGHLWDHPDEEPEEDQRGWLERSRAFRTLRMMVSDGTLASGRSTGRKYEKQMSRSGDFKVPGVDGAMRGEGLGDIESVDSKTQKKAFAKEDVSKHILTDLRRIKAICDERDIALVLGQYWADFEWIDRHINAPVAQFGKDAGVPVLATRDRMRALVAEHGHMSVLCKDTHANSFGNREVARIVLRTLVESEILESRPEWLDIDEVEAVLGRPYLELLGSDGGVLDLEVCAPKRMPFAFDLTALFEGADTDSVEEVPIPRRRLAEFTPPPLIAGGIVPPLGARVRQVTLPETDDAEQRLGSEGRSLVGWRVTAALYETPEDRRRDTGGERTNSVDVRIDAMDDAD